MIQSKDPTSTLLFIPDISGFTQFVNDTDISHSRHIIEELLEIIIDADTLGLKISEIEGDAILFYREGAPPSQEELLEQVESMYTAFHSHLKRYETQRICQCGACSTAHKLSLKFVAHFGDVAKKQVKDFTKLFGREVIVAHRLLKNDIPFGEYVLTTEALSEVVLDRDHKGSMWAEPVAQNASYDVGEISYSYLSLAPLAARVPEPVVEDYALPGLDAQLMAHETEIQAPIELVFDVVADMGFRHHWLEGLKGSTDLNGKIAHNGSTHRCIIKGDDSDPFFVSHDFKRSGDEITFTDTNYKERFSNVFQLIKLGPERTRVVMHTFVKRNVLKQWVFKLFIKRKLVNHISKSLDRLGAYCRTLVASDQQHPVQIVLLPIDDGPISSISKASSASQMLCCA